jgi:hypothetical protein
MNHQKLKIDKNFEPLPINEEDEFFANGIFEFNITKLIAYVRANHEIFPIEFVDLKILYMRSISSIGIQRLIMKDVIL